MTTLSTLLPALERAEAGSARLDLLISYVVDTTSTDDLRRIELFSAEDYLPERIAALLGRVPKPYTSSLDAAVPGENIVLSMYAPTKGRWAAIHRRPGGEEDLHWGATEPLARRIAALHALAAESGEADEPLIAERPVLSEGSDAKPSDVGAPNSDDGETTPWKILF